jgi:hypothetical protein
MERPCEFFADSASRSVEQFKVIDRAGFSHSSVSYRKWAIVPERTAAELL